MADTTLKQMIEQMEKRYQDLSVKLEAYREMHAEMATLARAIKVLKGEKLTVGYVSAKDRLAAEQNADEPAVSAYKPGSVQDALRQIMRANPKGMSIGDMSLALSRKGFNSTSVMVHNALRYFKSDIKVVREEGTKKIYALAKE